MRSLRVHVVGVAVAEGPIFPGGFGEDDYDFVGRDAGGLGEELGDAFVEFAFLLGLATVAEGDVDEDHSVGAVDAEVVWVVEQVGGGVLGDDLEAVVGGDGDGFDHGAVDGVG